MISARSTWTLWQDWVVHLRPQYQRIYQWSIICMNAVMMSPYLMKIIIVNQFKSVLDLWLFLFCTCSKNSMFSSSCYSIGCLWWFGSLYQRKRWRGKERLGWSYSRWYVSRPLNFYSCVCIDVLLLNKSETGENLVLLEPSLLFCFNDAVINCLS